jgi:hypothetical protein
MPTSSLERTAIAGSLADEIPSSPSLILLANLLIFFRGLLIMKIQTTNMKITAATPIAIDTVRIKFILSR